VINMRAVGSQELHWRRSCDGCAPPLPPRDDRGVISVAVLYLRID
jgi:hypothetical protein